MIIKLLKTFYWDLCEKNKRFAYINYFLTDLPGSAGFILRSTIISRYFKKCGEEISIAAGTQYRGIENIEIGDYVRIGADNYLQGSAGLTIGNHTLLGNDVKIWTINHTTADIEKPIFEQGYDKNPVTIGNNVWIGANSFIMPGVNLPDGCIVSAGSIVGLKNYPPFSIIAGNPARVIGNRQKNKD